MKSLFPFFLLSLTLMGQDTPGETARGLISSSMIASFEPLGSRPARTDLTLVYLDNVKDDQFVEVGALRTEASTIIREAGSSNLAPEAFAKALAKGLFAKHPQIAGITVTLGLNLQTTSQFVVTLTRLAPNLTPALTSEVSQSLADARNAQSRIVR